MRRCLMVNGELSEEPAGEVEMEVFGWVPIELVTDGDYHQSGAAPTLRGAPRQLAFRCGHHRVSASGSEGCNGTP